MTIWLSSIKLFKKKKTKRKLSIFNATQLPKGKKKVSNLPLLRFPMILQHFHLEEFQAMHRVESNSEIQVQIQQQERFLDGHV